jgi:hypothetical protein
MEGAMIPSLTLVLSSKDDVARADAILSGLSSRYEIVACGPDAARDGAVDRFQWTTLAPDLRTALQRATGDLVAIADPGADLSEIGWLMPWASECPVIRSEHAPAGWLKFLRAPAPAITLIRRTELRRLLSNAVGSHDAHGLAAAAERAGLPVAVPRPSLVA